MNRNTLLAIALSVVIWFGYYSIFPPPKQKPIEKPEKVSSEKITTEKEKPVSKQHAVKKEQIRKQRDFAKKTAKGSTGEGGGNKLVFEKTISINNLRATEGEILQLETDIYQIRVSPVGGSITSFRYKKYQGPDKKPVELVTQNDRYPGEKVWPFALRFDNGKKEFFKSTESTIRPLYSLSREQRTDSSGQTAIILAKTRVRINNIPAMVIKNYEFPQGKNFFVFRITIQNLDSKKVIESPAPPMLKMGYLVGPDLDLDDPYNPIKFGYYSGEKYSELSKEGSIFSDKPPALTKVEDTKIRWFAIQSRYFLFSIIPQKPFDELWADTRPNSAFTMGARLDNFFLKPGSSYERKFFVYVGEKEKKAFQKATGQMKTSGYDWPNLAESLKNTIDAHWSIEIIRDLLLRFLIFLNSFLGNYGVALIIFATLTKVVFWPLNQKSAKSMKKMGQLAPQMKALKENFKGNPTEINKQTMALYKKHGVNPASGCLPILIQMPFFFALYSALSNSVELWNAPFMLWITDLSKPDTITKLPEYLGGFNLNILPLVMVVTQFFQQKLTTSSADANQQKMMKFLPLVFIFIFWTMPSGLVLYWSVQNVLSIGQQLYTNYSSDNANNKKVASKQPVLTDKTNKTVKGPTSGRKGKSKKSKRRHG